MNLGESKATNREWCAGRDALQSDLHKIEIVFHVTQELAAGPTLHQQGDKKGRKRGAARQRGRRTLEHVEKRHEALAAEARRSNGVVGADHPHVDATILALP